RRSSWSPSSCSTPSTPCSSIVGPSTPHAYSSLRRRLGLDISWDVSVRTAAGESSRTPRRAPAQRRTSTPLFDHLVRPEQDRLRDREAERLGGLEVDHELELCRLLDRQVAGLGAFEDFVNVGGRTAVQRGNVRAIG